MQDCHDAIVERSSRLNRLLRFSPDLQLRTHRRGARNEGRASDSGSGPAREYRRRPVFFSAVAQHDAPHRVAADAPDVGDEFRLARPAAAAVMPDAIEDIAEWQIGLHRVHLVHHALPTASLAGNAQEPRWERVEWLVQGLGAGWQWPGAAAAPVVPGDRARRHGLSGGSGPPGRTMRARNALTRASASGSSSSSGTGFASRPRRLVAVTIAGFTAGGAGSAGASSFAGGGVGFGSSATGGVSASVRRVALVTIAGMAGARRGR